MPAVRPELVNPIRIGMMPHPQQTPATPLRLSVVAAATPATMVSCVSPGPAAGLLSLSRRSNPGTMLLRRSIWLSSIPSPITAITIFGVTWPVVMSHPAGALVLGWAHCCG
jgi:hypothetical protein